MNTLWPKSIGVRRDERGFTLPEALTVIVILGILIAIGFISWLGILERRRVDAATNQLAADLRLAHTNATNQLTDWRVVLVPENADEDEGPDYYMVKLAAPYPATSPPAVDPNTPPKPRTFPGNVKIVNIAGTLDTGGGGWVVWPSIAGQTRTIEFNADGAMRFYGGVSGSTCVTVDGSPENRVTVLAATSRVKIKADAC
jgi:prepilin-type N-terminal cleavage/methylation domain-containing protein